MTGKRDILPTGKPHRGGVEPQPGDEKFGDYTRERLLQMDNKFATAVEQALRRGDQSATAAAAEHERKRR